MGGHLQNLASDIATLRLLPWEEQTLPLFHTARCELKSYAEINKTGYAVDSTVYKMLDHAGRAQTLAAPQSQQNEIFVEI